MQKKYLIGVLQTILILIVLTGVCVLFIGNQQSRTPIALHCEFSGEYSRDGITWQEITEQSDLSATSGDIFLRGHFNLSGGEYSYLYFYMDHIGYEIYVNGELAESYDESTLGKIGRMALDPHHYAQSNGSACQPMLYPEMIL